MAEQYWGQGQGPRKSDAEERDYFQRVINAGDVTAHGGLYFNDPGNDRSKRTWYDDTGRVVAGYGTGGPDGPYAHTPAPAPTPQTTQLAAPLKPPTVPGVQIPGAPQPGPGGNLPPMGPQPPQQPGVDTNTPGRPPGGPAPLPSPGIPIPGAPLPPAGMPGTGISTPPPGAPPIFPGGPSPTGPAGGPPPPGGGSPLPQGTPQPPGFPTPNPNGRPLPPPPPPGAPPPPGGGAGGGTVPPSVPGFPNPVYGDDERRRRYFEGGNPAPVAQPLTMARVPTEAEMDLLPVGQSIETPIGTLLRDPQTGRAGITLNAQGQQAWQAAHARLKANFGNHAFSTDPNAPQPELIPGKANFNPLTGQWLGR